MVWCIVLFSYLMSCHRAEVRIDLAQTAAKTLRPNFLETNLKDVIYISPQTIVPSESLIFLPHEFTIITLHHPPVCIQASLVNRFSVKNIPATVH